MERHINLNMQRSFFEEIYYKDHNAHYWKSPSLGKSPRYLIVFSVILLITTLFVVLSSPKEEPSNIQFGMIATVFVGFLLVLSSYVRKVVVIQKWKKDIKVFLDELEQYQKHALILSEDSITIIKDDQQKVIKWDEFQTSDFTDFYFMIKGTETIFVPAKSMTPSDFKFSSNFFN